MTTLTVMPHRSYQLKMMFRDGLYTGFEQDEPRFSSPPGHAATSFSANTCAIR